MDVITRCQILQQASECHQWSYHCTLSVVFQIFTSLLLYLVFTTKTSYCPSSMAMILGSHEAICLRKRTYWLLGRDLYRVGTQR
jgi:hypothetical protein